MADNDTVVSNDNDPDEIMVAIGDVVQLKSGGPPMVIVKLNELDQMIECEWFDDASTLYRREFEPLVLQLYCADDDHTRGAHHGHNH